MRLEKLQERFSPEKVEQWKKEFAPRKINVIEVEGKFAVLHPITSNEVANFAVMTSNNDIGLEKACRYLIEEMWVDGDNEILNDEEYFIGAMLQVQATMELKKSSFFRV
jgi:hypothetical protein